MAKTRKTMTAGPAARAAAHARQQEARAAQKAETRRGMAEIRDKALADGNTEMAAFWSDYLADLG